MTTPDAPSPDLAERYEFGLTLITDAGAVALDYFGRVGTLEIHSKGAQDMASEADIAVEALIKQRLAERFPRDAFLGEESGHTDLDGATGIWVVDPIDGTQPFVNGMRAWCISIGYVRDGAVQFGMVFNPSAGELFTGAGWLPAQLNGREIHPSRSTTLADGMTFLGASPRIGPDDVVPVLDRLLRAGGMFVRSGSGALGLCDVACGRVIGYVEAHINSWDCLGAIAVLQAAGCQVNDFLANDGLLHGNRIITGPPALYDQLVALYG